MKTTCWIVNEDGKDIEIVDGKGSDGCLYQSSHDGKFVERIIPDAEGCWVDGQFDMHERPFVDPALISLMFR